MTTVPVDGIGEELGAVLTLRRAAEVVVSAVRTTAAGRDEWWAHRIDDVVLLEQVSPEGHRHVALARAADLPALVVGALLHPAAGDAAAPVPDAAVEWLRADVVVRQAGPGRAATLRLVSAPSGCWRLPDGCCDPQALTVATARRLLVALLPPPQRSRRVP